MRNETRAASGLTVARLFVASAARDGGRPALQSGAAVLSYAALLARVAALAQGLAQRGLVRGDRIAVLSENRAEYIELYLAAAWLGLIVAAQNWRLAWEELHHCIALADPRLAFVSPRHADALSAAGFSAGETIVLGPQYEALIDAAQSGAPPDVAEAEDGLAILYTSGTTGLPKGALISHRAFVARATVIALDTPVTRDDAFIAWSPLFHMGSADSTLAALMSGGKVIVVDGFDLTAILNHIACDRIGDLPIVPGVLTRLIEALHAERIVPRGIKLIGVMADLAPPAQIAEITTLLAAPFRNTFGSTETGSPPASRATVAIGVQPTRLSKQQSSLCDIRLVDEDDIEVADGAPGEMTLRGPTLFSGYWRNEAANAEDFRGGRFHMGDVFVRNEDRTLDFVDRRKYLIKSGGENIYPAEIERVLLSLPGVIDAAVVGRRDAQWGESLVAFIASATPMQQDAVIAACRGRIAGYKIPREIHFVAESDLPRNGSGKIQRRELAARLTAAPHP